MSSEFGLLLVTGNQTHQENYARAFAADERCRLVGLTDNNEISPRRRQLNQDLADELQIPYLDSFDAAIARDDVDLVSICSEPERRRDLTIPCAAAGKHLYLDKDPAPTVSDAWLIAKAAQDYGVWTQAFSLVRLPAYQRAKAVLESGKLGRLIGLHCDATFAKGITGTADLTQPRIEKGTADQFTFIDSKREFLCVGYYALVLFQWLTGNRFTSVDAVTANYFFAEHQNNDVEDFASVMLGMEGGLETTINAGRCGWTSHRSYGIHEIRLIGTEGSVTIDAHRPRLEICSDAEPWTQPAEGHPEDPMGFWSSTQKAGGVEPKDDWPLLESVSRSDASCFLDCLEENRASDVPVEMAAHCVDVVHAVYQSAAASETVTLKDQRGES